MERVAACLSVAVFLVGCGPSLDPVVRSTQSFAVAQRCSQGPFEIHVPAFGSRWGEDVTVEAHGNAIDGHATMSVGAQRTIEQTFTTSGASVDAHACTLSDADRVAASAGATSSTASSTSASAGASSAAATQASVALVRAGLAGSWLYRTEIAKYHYEVDEWTKASGVLKKGDDIKIVFWSEHPLDLNGTTFVVTHTEMLAPGGNDKKWEAHLDEVKSDAERKQREAEADAKKQQAEAAIKAREEARCGAVQGADATCRGEGYKTGSELVAYAEFQRKCEDLARNNATDQACRDDGWRNDNERPGGATASTTTPSAPTSMSAIVTRPADRPPPAPQAETEPPKPSEHAEWVPGSWQWSGADWVWLGGGWRVPEQDRAMKLTATAPSAPPVARVDVRPAQPITNAVWAEGYWHYAGARWIWVPGHWAVPPRIGATWRPSTWVPDGVQLRLDPGGWR